jgi:uncharacterized NAD(P)/FAD-binding protein YdhS
MDAIGRLGIVGGGSVGISFLAQLVAHLESSANSAGNVPGCHITLFEPAEKIGHGTAYQHDLNTNLLNVPAGNMSLYDKHRSHFVQWVAQQPEALLQSYGIRDIDPAAFYPRPLFGRYVHEQFDRIVAQAAALGVHVQVVRNAVVAIARHATGQGQAPEPEPEAGQEAQSQIQLTDLAGTRYVVDQLVLCNGNLASDKFDALVSCAGFMNSPYPVSALSQAIAADATVAILGANLSAIDAVVALKAHGHGGQIHCFSRQGVLPAVRSVHPTHISCRPSRADVHAMALAKGGRLALDDVVGMLRKHMLAIDPGFDIRDIAGGADAATLLNRELHAACSGPRPWQTVLAAANEVIDLLWFYLDQPGKRQFQSRWRSRWMSRRAMFPVQNARQLQSLIETGQLHIHGGFQACEALANRQGFVLHCSDTAGALSQQACDVVINATGFSQDVRQSSDPLITQLLQSGLARASEYGGFELDFDTGCLITANGTIANDITVLGSLACGTYFWTVSMDVNARLANEQAARLARKLCQQYLAKATGVPAAAEVATQV